MLSKKTIDTCLGILTLEYNNNTAAILHFEHQLTLPIEHRIIDDLSKTEIEQRLADFKEAQRVCSDAIEDLKSYSEAPDLQPHKDDEERNTETESAINLGNHAPEGIHRY